MSRTIRTFWTIYGLVALGFIVLVVGPRVEGLIRPIRSTQSIEDVGRVNAFLRFDWVSEKTRMAPGGPLDVALVTPSDRFEVTLYNDTSAPGEPRCSRILPWARSMTVGVGPHRQSYCVEIPRTVTASDRIELVVVAHYGGLLGLWDLPVRFPPIVYTPTQ